jgi:hypothetical protein
MFFNILFLYFYNLSIYIMPNTGNINYSLNKNNFYTILIGCISYYVPYYFILVIISVAYIYTIKYKQYIFPDRAKKYEKDEDIIHFFKSITYNSPFNILEFCESDKDNEKYTGLSNKSYIFIIVTYIITLFLILEGLLRNLLYSIYANIIQVNNNNNPYNNVNCINKISENANISTTINYTAIISLSVNFLFPFIIPFLLWSLKFDNYDIKHNFWIRYVILYFVFYPFLMMLLSKAAFYKKLEVFPGLKKFIEPKDYNFIDFIVNSFNFKIYNVIPFLFIIFVFCYYVFVHSDFRYDLKKKIIIYIIIALLLFVFVPIFLIFFALSVLFSNNLKNKSSGDTITDIKNNGITSMYDLLVKYNYPCFKK